MVANGIGAGFMIYQKKQLKIIVIILEYYVVPRYYKGS